MRRDMAWSWSSLLIRRDGDFFGMYPGLVDQLLSNPWNVAAFVGLAFGVLLFCLPLLGDIGQRLTNGGWWAKAHIAFYFGAFIFAFGYLTCG